MKRLPLSAPYSTPAMDAAWRKRVSEEHDECKKRNPKLMRRLGKLTDDQLNRVYAAILETEPPSASRDWELRTLRELEAFRAMLKPKRGEKVLSLRDPQPEHRAPLHGTPPELAGLIPTPTVQPTPIVEPPTPPAPPAPAQPSNVIFAGKFFHNGRTTPRWIGHE